MTTARLDSSDPALGFSAMHGLNVFSLMLLLPHESLPDWLMVGAPLLVVLLAFWLNCRIYRIHGGPPQFARSLSQKVPAIRDFPLVYAYLLATFVLFFGCIYLDARSAA